MRLHATVTGAGAPVVLIHGFTGDASAWDAHVPALAVSRRVVAVDLPGHGRSPAPSAGTRIADAADAVVDALDRLAIARADVLGYSLGGRVALHVALRHPARVGRLVLESTSPGMTDAAARAARAAADDGLAAVIVRDGLPAFVDRWLAQPLFASQAALPAAVRAAERARRLAQRPEALAAALRAFSVGRQAPLLDALPALRAPTLLVVGAGDPAYRAHAAAMAARLPDARVHVVAGAGHTPHLENPDAFRDAVAAFLADAPAVATAS